MLCWDGEIGCVGGEEIEDWIGCFCVVEMFLYIGWYFVVGGFGCSVIVIWIGSIR